MHTYLFCDSINDGLNGLELVACADGGDEDSGVHVLIHSAALNLGDENFQSCGDNGSHLHLNNVWAICAYSASLEAEIRVTVVQML